MQPNWDNLDKRMLSCIVEHPGGSIRDVIKPFLKERTETTLRVRVRALWVHDLIEMRPGVNKVQCYPLLNNIKKEKDMRGVLGDAPL
ncbi:MAG: hypothetical protein ACYDHX_07955 [Methanothrix sp.]